MRCGLLAEDCAITHWCLILGGQRERANWRANCPVCHATRALEWDVPSTSIRWNSFCPCDHGVIRKALADLLPGCLPNRSKDKTLLRHDDLIALALDTSLPPRTLRLRLLQMAGMGTQDALDKLNVRREHRSRVIGGRTGAPKRVQNRRSLLSPIWVTCQRTQTGAEPQVTEGID